MTEFPTHVEVARKLLNANTIEKLEALRPLLISDDVTAAEILTEIFNHRFSQLCKAPPQRPRKTKK
jgi:hypothetical protein